MEEYIAKINEELIQSLKKFIRPHVRNAHDVDDILQNVLLKVMKNGDDIPAGSFLPWLQTVCRTTSIDFYRKNKMKFSDLDGVEEKLASVEESISPLQLAECIRPLLEKLKREDSKILEAVEFEGVSQNDLAEKLEMNYSALKSKVQRARQKLKEEILECCSVELDRRNTLINYAKKKKNDCC